MPRVSPFYTYATLHTGGRRRTARGGNSPYYMRKPLPFTAKQLAAKKAALKTRTKTKPKLNTVAKENRGGSESTFQLIRKIKNPVVKKLNKDLAKMFLISNSSQIYSQTAGRQGCATVTTCFGFDDINRIQLSTLQQQYGGTTPTGYKTLKVLLESVECECIYTNNTNAVCRLLLFDIIPKRDIYVDTGGNPIDPVQAWAQGLQHEGSGTNANEVLGSMPFNSALFCQYFTVKRIVHITLAPGQTHHHRIKFVPNAFFNMERFQQTTTIMYKGVSLTHMSVQYGEPVLDNAASVTTEATKLLNICKKHVKWSYIPNDMTTTYLNDNLAKTAGTNIENVVTGASAAFAAV